MMGDKSKDGAAKSIPRLTLAQEMAEMLDIPESTSREYLLRLVYLIAAHVKAGDIVVLSPLGTFKARTRTSYLVRDFDADPEKKIRVPSRLIMNFRQSNKLKNFLADETATPDMAPERLRHGSCGRKKDIDKDERKDKRT